MCLTKIEDWKTIWATRDAKTGIPTKRFLFSFDVKRITYTLIVVDAGCGWTCKKFWVHITGGVFGKEIEEDDVGENQGRRKGSEDKEDVHFGGLWIENIEEERIGLYPKEDAECEVRGEGMAAYGIDIDNLSLPLIFEWNPV